MAMWKKMVGCGTWVGLLGSSSDGLLVLVIMVVGTVAIVAIVAICAIVMWSDVEKHRDGT